MTHIISHHALNCTCSKHILYLRQWCWLDVFWPMGALPATCREPAKCSLSSAARVQCSPPLQFCTTKGGLFLVSCIWANLHLLNSCAQLVLPRAVYPLRESLAEGRSQQPAKFSGGAFRHFVSRRLKLSLASVRLWWAYIVKKWPQTTCVLECDHGKVQKPSLGGVKARTALASVSGLRVAVPIRRSAAVPCTL